MGKTTAPTVRIAVLPPAESGRNVSPKSAVRVSTAKAKTSPTLPKTLLLEIPLSPPMGGRRRTSKPSPDGGGAQEDLNISTMTSYQEEGENSYNSSPPTVGAATRRTSFLRTLVKFLREKTLVPP